MSTAGDRDAEDALVRLYERRLAAADQAELAAHDAVRHANCDLAATQQAKLAALAALDTLRRVIASSRGACQPLPSDVLLEVFAFSCARGASAAASTSPIQTALVLAGVCKAWRGTALSSGRLWSTVTLDLVRLNCTYRFLKMILTRSGSVPLHVQLLNVPPWNFEDPVLDESQVLELCRRSRSMRIWFTPDASDDPDAPGVGVSATFLPYFQSTMPLLEEFSFYNCNSAAFGYPTQLFTLAPKLKHIDLHEFPIDVLLPVSLPNLESLTLASWQNPSQLLAVSHGWPQLKRIAIRTREQALAAPSVTPTFSHLEVLNCIDGDSPGCGTLFSLSPERAPRLTELLMSGAAFARLELFLAGAPYLSLERLVVHGSFPPGLVGLFALLPNLARVTAGQVVDAAHIENGFEAWARIPESAQVAPKLRALVFQECSFTLASAQRLLALLQLRASSEDGVHRIAELRIVQTDKKIAHAFPLWLRPRLEELVKELVLDTDAIQYWPEDEPVS